MVALEQIRKPIEQEMERFLEVFRINLTHSNPLLQEVLTRITSRNGKMMRPLLTILSAKLLGNVNDSTLYSAATFEFFHTASLVHDDIVDESEQRRGQASINNSYGNKIAVLVGDYILACALHNAAMTNCPRIIDVFSLSAQQLANGELLQLHNIDNEKISEEIYYDIIKNKTAALFASCSQSGAISATDNEDDIQTLREFGEIVGICFQIRDDIFDYLDEGEIGKPTGNDMKEGKLTLPVIHALLSTDDKEMYDIAYKVKSLTVSHDEVARLVDFTKRNGGIEYAEHMMDVYANKAKALLDRYPDNDVRKAMYDFVDFVVERNK